MRFKDLSKGLRVSHLGPRVEGVGFDVGCMV